MDRFDPFVKYADVYGDIINWEKDPMNKPQNQNKYFFSDGKTYYEQICKMLRLMSVFKEAFNQIYSNEDEISEAWENFVNNLSASVVEGSEPDVTLTWTDDSVNFEFTMVPGVPGEQGVGITSISFNSDYTMTITLSDGNTYTSMSLKGETGPQGETGSGLQILDVYATLADLQSAHPTGQPGDAYQVGSEGSYTLYIWSSSQSAWVPAGSLGTISPSLSNPLMDGTASAGSQNLYSRGDHVHPTDTSRASKEELDALIKTSQSLIDQSFTYRESPAIQDGLARIDNIKGNTLVWNQLVQNGNFATADGWASSSSTNMTIVGASNNRLLFTTSSVIAAIMNTQVSFPKNHKLLFKLSTDLSNLLKIRLYTRDWVTLLSPTELTKSGDFQYLVINPLTDDAGTLYIIPSVNDNVQHYISNVQVFDLTALGIDNLTNNGVLEWFATFFPLSYYSYNQGSLLSFIGNGIKTVGKNLLGEMHQGLLNVSDGYSIQSNPYWLYSDFYPCKNAEYITFSANIINRGIIYKYDANRNFIGISQVMLNYKYITTPNTENICWIRVGFNINGASQQVTPQDIGTYEMQLELNSLTPYEPYTSSTLSLPISTYFPTGMKSAGNVYDELTPTKAITRFIKYTITGTEDVYSWGQNYGTHYGGALILPSYIEGRVKGGAITNGIASMGYTVNFVNNNMTIYMNSAGDRMSIINDAFTSREQWLEGITGIEIILELATPTETSIDLDLSFKSYLDGTEQLLPVNGPVPSTSPIIADMTYLSIDDAMEYILDKLANVPQNTQQILESLEDDVADLQTDTGALQTAVSGLQTSVGNINTNIGQLSSTVAGHTASISDMQSDITDLNTDLGDLSDTVTDHTSRIGTLESGLSTTNGNVQNLETSVSDIDDTVTAQGTTVTALDSIISDISNNPVVSALGSHELGFVAAYVEATLAANAGTRVTIPKPTIFPNNYTPLFIVGMSTGAYNVSICEIPPTFGNSDSVKCRVWNHGSQQTTQITVYILCMRQRQSQ